MQTTKNLDIISRLVTGENSIEKKEKVFCIYFIVENKPRWYDCVFGRKTKIGRAKDIRQTINELSRGNSRKLFLRGIIIDLTETESQHLLERLRDENKYRRLENDWFTLRKNDIVRSSYIAANEHSEYHCPTINKY